MSHIRESTTSYFINWNVSHLNFPATITSASLLGNPFPGTIHRIIFGPVMTVGVIGERVTGDESELLDRVRKGNVPISEQVGERNGRTCEIISKKGKVRGSGSRCVVGESSGRAQRHRRVGPPERHHHYCRSYS
ncbi:hypothetical protein J6590_010873 [Homalodisca vitripennis]|nr:hypothetical protein J6590_010873 [Homalodisca vitripennis]